MPQDIAADTVDLLQQLIRNRCVNNGQPDSGNEAKSVATLKDFFAPSKLPFEVYEPHPGRQSILFRLPGTDPSAPSLMLMGHTDVVPVSEEGWSRDPFAGDLSDGWVWGRGAVDMLNLTASMAVAVREIAMGSFRPRGDLFYLGVADEEAGGTWGAQWLQQNAADDIKCTWCITESGGIQIPTPGGTRLWTVIGEKGVHWLRLTVHGTPSHGSRPLGTDNALVTAAEIINRLVEFKPKPLFSPAWKEWVRLMGFDADLQDALTSPDRIWEAIDELSDNPILAGTVHACTHLTVAPTVVHGGTKTNVIPDRIELEIDMRKLPEQTAEDADRLLRDALGELYSRVEITTIMADNPSQSETSTPIYQAMQRAATSLVPNATLLPAITTGGTDARFFRELGIPAYGFGLFSEKMTLDLWQSMFHGNDERVDVESLRLSTELWIRLIQDVLA